MSGTRYYKTLQHLFASQPPAGGAKKSKSASKKKATSETKNKTTVNAKGKSIVRKRTAKGAKKQAAAKTTRRKGITERTPATAAKKQPSEKSAANKTTAKAPTAEVKTTSRAPTRGRTAEPKAKRASPRREAAERKGVSVQRLVVKRSLNKSLESLKQRVEAAKFFTPIQEVMPEPEMQELPYQYGRCRIVCMARDPYWLHAYWEVTDKKLGEAESFFGEEWNKTKTVLRVHDITGTDFTGENANAHFDIELSAAADNWYINVNSPNSSFVVDITRTAASGRSFVLARSNTVTTPRDGMSDILDEEWMSLDFDKMYALSGGFKIGSSSLEMHEMMKQRLVSEISSWGGSGAVSSFGGSPVAEKKRGFWFMLDCELIVYGATEPDAKVTMQGVPVILRPDGTFTLRFALPDGVQEIETTAVSADGAEERTITPIVSRMTESREKALKEL